MEYRKPGAADSVPPRWAIEVATNQIWLESHWSADDPPEPLVLNTTNVVCHVTLLGLMQTNGSIQLPAIMHLPDQGSFRITAGPPPAANALGYAAQYDGKNVQITVPGATQENPLVKYCWEAVAIHPDVANIDADEHFDGFRRDWLNIFQLSPHWHTLANHAASDTCAFCYYEYADIAAINPAAGFIVGWRPSIWSGKRSIKLSAGAMPARMPGHGAFPEYSSDTLPSLLIAATDYVQTRKDDGWLTTNYDHLKSWG